MEPNEDAEDYRRHGLNFVKVSLEAALDRLTTADLWATEVQQVPEPLRQRIKELHIECRRAVKEAEEVL